LLSFGALGARNPLE